MTLYSVLKYNTCILHLQTSAAVIDLIHKQQAGITILDNQFPTSQHEFVGDIFVSSSST